MLDLKTNNNNTFFNDIWIRPRLYFYTSSEYQSIAKENLANLNANTIGYLFWWHFTRMKMEQDRQIKPIGSHDDWVWIDVCSPRLQTQKTWRHDPRDQRRGLDTCSSLLGTPRGQARSWTDNLSPTGLSCCRLDLRPSPCHWCHQKTELELPGCPTHQLSKHRFLSVLMTSQFWRHLQCVLVRGLLSSDRFEGQKYFLHQSKHTL